MSNIIKSNINTVQRSTHKWWALVILALAQFLVVLDASIVNIALPSMGKDLHLNTDMLSWVITAYVVPFGGLLLLGGRLADRFGHRRIFIAGVIGFILASASAGLSTSGVGLLISRGVQGASAGFLAPAALALVTILFTQKNERTKALGIWGTVVGIGSAAGVLLGGILTSIFGWSAVFFINVPIAAIVIITIPILISRDSGMVKFKTDLAGAITVTGGLVAIVASLSEVQLSGWSNPIVLILAVIGVLLLIAFVLIEMRSPAPLVSFGIFRNSSVTGGNLAMLFMGGAMVGMFYALSVYMQHVLHYSALTAGLTQLPLAGALVVVAGVVPAFISEIGTKWTLVSSLVLFAVGLIWLSFAPSDASFVIHLLAPTLVIGAGLGGAFVCSTEMAVHGVAKRDEGLASGLVNTSQQVGGALGLAILASFAATHTDSLTSAGSSMPQAMTGGFSWLFMGAAVFAIVGALLVVIVKWKDKESSSEESKVV